MDELIETLTMSWNEITEWTGRAKEMSLPQHLEIPRWLQHLIVFCALYSTFSITSGYYLIRGKRKLICRHKALSSILLKVRVLFALCLAMCPVIQLASNIHYDVANWVDITVCGFMMFGWLVHQQYLRVVETEMCVHHAGHFAVNMSWVLTLTAFMYQVCFSFYASEIGQDELKNKWDDGILYSIAVCQTCYFLVLVVSLLCADKGYNKHFSVHKTMKKNEPAVTSSVTNFFSSLTFHWVDTLMDKGAKNLLNNANDLIDLPPSLQSQNIDRMFLEAYERLKLKSRKFENADAGDSSKLAKPVPLFEALLQCFGSRFFLLGFLKLGTDCVGFLAPVLLNKLLTYLETDGLLKQEAYYYAFCLCVCTLITTLLNAQFFFLIYKVALKIRAAIIMTIYRKILTTNGNELMKLNLGELVNYMSNDADRIINFCPNFHNLWSLPLQILTCMYLLYTQVESASICGIVFGVIVIYINFHIAKKIAKLSDIMMAEKDERVKLMSETLHGISAVKFNAWERHFVRWISGLRDTEVKSLSGRKYLDAICVYFWATSTMLISFLTFFTYVFLLGKSLTTAKVFTSLALINILLLPLNVFPWTVNALMEAWVSLKRIERLLSLPELNRRQFYTKIVPDSRRFHLQIKDAIFVWGDSNHVPSVVPVSSKSTKKKSHKKQDILSAGDRKTNISPTPKKFILGPINMDVIEGQFIGVFGKVGSGKTSLLHAIMGEMWKTSGTVAVRRHDNGYGYVPQEVWVQKGTIKENILFGAPMDIDRYQAVLEACALVEDLEKLPAGDSTEIGERATTLSGGQKARLVLARAVYQKKKLYLLDHCLSCVDTQVAHHIFENCIRGLLKDTTKIVCTHQMKLLFHADYVYVMKDGKILEKGSPAAVFAKKMQIPSSSILTSSTPGDLESKSLRVSQTITNQSSITLGELPAVLEPLLVQDEEMAEGGVKYRIYRYYCAAVGEKLSLLILLLLAAMQISKNATDWWLAYWLAQHADNSHNRSQSTVAHASTIAMQPNVPYYKDIQSYNVYVYRAITMVTNYDTLDENVYEEQLPMHEDGSFFFTYTALIVVNSICALCRAFSFARGGIVAAVNMHDTLLYQVLKAPMDFFHSTPVGRILNRFSTDIYAIDNTLPFMLNIFLAQTFGLLGILVISCYGLPWIFLLFVPLFIFYMKIQRNYRQTSRDVKRISLNTLSSLYAHFSETFSGSITIRALKAEKRLIEENLFYLEKSQKAIYAIQVSGIWLSLRLHLIGVVIVTGIAVLAILQSNSVTTDVGYISKVFLLSEDLMNKAIVCLTMTYALAITNMLNNLVWSFTEMEKEMVSCERVLNYSETLGSEKWSGTVSPAEEWPSAGRISFDNVTVQYKHQNQVALRRINLQVFPGEKIGIVGRTGSGKSSLFRALFRLEELMSGRIVVDGLDIRHLDLIALRSRIGIIPQDPFVFSGTIRDNLDPNNNYNSYELWTVLDKCHIVDAVHRVGGLDTPIREAGKDFSTGQKQLLCLARALLHNSQILCIDEVTANVDHETDLVIHRTIDSLFKNRTVMVIAHRIENVLNCSRVVVLSRGEIIEEDNPQKLLSQSSSEFYRLASKVLSYSTTVMKNPSGRFKGSTISGFST